MWISPPPSTIVQLLEWQFSSNVSFLPEKLPYFENRNAKMEAPKRTVKNQFKTFQNWVWCCIERYMFSLPRGCIPPAFRRCAHPLTVNLDPQVKKNGLDITIQILWGFQMEVSEVMGAPHIQDCVYTYIHIYIYHFSIEIHGFGDPPISETLKCDLI